MLGRLSCTEAVAKADAPLPPTCEIAGCQSLLITVTIEIGCVKLSIANILQEVEIFNCAEAKLAMAMCFMSCNVSN
jgi:hypothetical protein